MITVGIVFEPDSDYVYTINTVMSQSYEAIEVICALYEGTGISAYDILECIRIHRGANVKRVYMISGKQQKTFAEHILDILQACQGEYLICLSSRDAFYDANAISDLAEASHLSGSVISGTTVLYQNGEYTGTFTPDKMGGAEVCLNSVADYIQQGYSLLLPTPLRNKIIPTANSHTNLSKDDFIWETFDVPCLRHESATIKECDSYSNAQTADTGIRYLNYTDGIYLKSFIEYILNCKNISESQILCEINSLRNYIIGKQSGGYWKITASDGTLLHYLQDVHEVFKTYPQKALRQKICLKRILKRAKKETRTSIKIVFLAQEYHLWPSLKSVYDTAVRDDRFSPELVHIPFSHIHKTTSASEELQCYRDAGYPIKEYDEYNLSEDSPDVVIVMKPYDSIPKEFLFNNLDKVVRRCIYIRYAPSANHVLTEKMREMFFELPAYFLMWKCLAYTETERQEAKQYSYCKGTDWLTIGHPRDDYSLDDLVCKDRQYYDHLQELSAGRKVFLWNTSAQMISKEGLEANGSFLDWGEKIIQYFAEREDIFLVWRPHPLFSKTLLEIWGKEKTSLFMNQVTQYKNIYIDEYKQYTPAFLLSDALISDTSSLIDLYIPSFRPIMLTKQKKQTLSQYDSEFTDAVYVLEKEEQISMFIEMAAAGKHAKSSLQENYARKIYISLNSDKKVAENLLDVIAKGIATEEKELFNARKEKIGELCFDTFVPPKEEV